MSKRGTIWRRAVAAVLLLAASGLFVGVAGEIMVRVARPQRDAPRYFERGGPYVFQLKPDFHQAYRFAPGIVMDVTTNALGLRDRDQDFSAPFPGKTIVFAGDSFLFGHGVNVPDRLDTFLAGLLDPEEKDYRIVNTGVPGWGTIQETNFVRDHFDTFRPDAVVVLFCGNDPDDDAQFLNDTGVHVQNALLGSFPGKDFLRVHSHLYRFVVYHATVMRHNSALRARQRQGEKIEIDPQTAGGISPEVWPRTLDTFRRFHQDLLAYNPRAILFLAATNPGEEDIRSNLASLDNGGSLRFIDLAPGLDKIPPDKLTLGFDHHWSPLAHKAVAEAFAEALRASGIAPPAPPN